MIRGSRLGAGVRSTIGLIDQALLVLLASSSPGSITVAIAERRLGDALPSRHRGGVRAAWAGIVSSITDPAERAVAEQLRGPIAAGTFGRGLSAHSVSHRAAFRMTHQYWHEHEGSLRSVVLRGRPEDLRRPNHCWEVRFSGSDMEGEISAYLSPRDGSVIVVLRHPEG